MSNKLYRFATYLKTARERIRAIENSLLRSGKTGVLINFFFDRDPITKHIDKILVSANELPITAYTNQGSSKPKGFAKDLLANNPKIYWPVELLVTESSRMTFFMRYNPDKDLWELTDTETTMERFNTAQILKEETPKEREEIIRKSLARQAVATRPVREGCSTGYQQNNYSLDYYDRRI